MDLKPKLYLPAIRHNTYYYEMATFKINNTLFKVPQYAFIQQSVIFRDMFSLPLGESGQGEGQTDDNPIQLPEVTVEEFSIFLSLLYPQPSIGQLIHRPQLQASEWLSVLRFASKYEFSLLRAYAITMLESKLDPVRRIEVSRAYVIKQWLHPALIELANRRESITLEEGRILGLETLVKLSAVRDSIHAHKEVKLEAVGSRRIGLMKNEVLDVDELIAQEFECL